MPTKTIFTEEKVLRKITLPTHGAKYAVVPHGTIIDEARKNLAAAGFSIDEETYKTTLNGQVAQGVYKLNYGNDSDLKLMFAWSNSYNKMMKFKCAIGATVIICMNGMVSGNLGNYKRRHSGTALADIIVSMKEQIDVATEHYDKLIKDKELLKSTSFSKEIQAGMIGDLFINQDIITTSQIAIIKREIEKPSFNYNCDPNSAWALYNHVTLSLKESHPMTYLTNHEKVHNFFINAIGKLICVPAPPKEEVMVVETVDDSLIGYGVNFV